MNQMQIKVKAPNESLLQRCLDNGLSINQSFILASRISEESSVNAIVSPTHLSIPSPLIYKDMEKSASRLAKAIIDNQKVVCAVDFDSDGINSGAIFYRAMTEFFNVPKEKCFVQISHRTLWGYGYTEYAVKNIFREHNEDLPALIITADQGSSNEKEIQLTYEIAKKNNHEVDVIVTDHHHIPPKGPDSAFAFINPQQQSDINQDAKDVCGAMIMLFLMLATKDKLIKSGFLDKKTKILELFSYATIATISDVMSLRTPCNRFICHLGFHVMNSSSHPCWTYLRGQSDSLLDESFVGFQLAPRINAGGRVGLSGKTGLDFLCATDIFQAKNSYSELTGANEERKDIGQKMLSEAFDLAQQQIDQGVLVIVIYLPKGNSGNSGIVAGKLKEYFNRPAIMLAPINQTESTGSARSIPGIDIRDCIQTVYETNPGLVSRFGGHPVAAGITCSTDNIDLFARALNEVIKNKVDLELLVPKFEVDFVLNSLRYPVALDFIDEMSLLKPFGQGFPAPSFAAQGTISEVKPIGKNEKIHLSFVLIVNKISYKCIWFNARSDEYQSLPVSNGDFKTFILSPNDNVFMKRRSFQFHVISEGKFDDNEKCVFL